ncbi:MAG: Exodeoxyribonuclease [Pseudomonadota bacterium]|jgi:exodeoxyribonuclease-3
MIRVVSWNVNGLRSALSKSLLGHLEALAPDVVLLQEVRSFPEQLPKGATDGWNVAWHPAKKPGYAGTAVWSRHEITHTERGLTDADDDLDGRMLRVDTAGLEVASVYLPSGASGPEKQANKEAWMARFLPWAAERAQRPVAALMGGDLNIAHTVRDIWNAKGNAKNSGFLPHERAWFSDLLATGWEDALRARVGDVQGPYSWWSNRGNARALDRGWRIDYLLTSPTLTPRVRGGGVHRAGGLDTSDHAPIWVDLAD